MTLSDPGDVENAIPLSFTPQSMSMIEKVHAVRRIDDQISREKNPLTLLIFDTLTDMINLIVIYVSRMNALLIFWPIKMSRRKKLNRFKSVEWKANRCLLEI